MSSGNDSKTGGNEDEAAAMGFCTVAWVVMAVALTVSAEILSRFLMFLDALGLRCI